MKDGDNVGALLDASLAVLAAVRGGAGSQSLAVPRSLIDDLHDAALDARRTAAPASDPVVKSSIPSENPPIRLRLKHDEYGRAVVVDIRTGAPVAGIAHADVEYRPNTGHRPELVLRFLPTGLESDAPEIGPAPGERMAP